MRKIKFSTIVNALYSNKLTYKQRELIAKMLRVDHAGELGANYIYKGQYAMLSDPHARKRVLHMWEQEKNHLKVFDEMLPSARVRPSLLRPFWEFSGYCLGAGTALLGKEAAMACTEAVETVIGNHYNDQIRELYKHEDNKEIKKLIKVLAEFRDEELEHKEIAIQEDSKNAPGYQLLNALIQTGCKLAIKVAEKI
jgi:ubiquinone biosynthesis monooxygenase Coq7